jgi:HSP20 family molecular chaperone IbpA
MPRPSLSAHPLLLGFEQIDRMLERASKSDAAGYPPYNIEVSGDDRYRISLAVAGFSEQNLTVAVEDGDLLVVRGEMPQDPPEDSQGSPEDSKERIFLHRGIAARRFNKSFVLAEGVDVVSARLEHGLLHVDLKRSEPTATTQRIRINNIDRH